MKLYTTAEAAKVLNVTQAHVSKLARRHGLKPRGHDYILTQSDLDLLKSRNTRRGRPSLRSEPSEPRP